MVIQHQKIEETFRHGNIMMDHRTDNEFVRIQGDKFLFHTHSCSLFACPHFSYTMMCVCLMMLIGPEGE